MDISAVINIVIRLPIQIIVVVDDDDDDNEEEEEDDDDEEDDESFTSLTFWRTKVW